MFLAVKRLFSKIRKGQDKLMFEVENYLVKELDNSEEIKEAQRLRCEIFFKTLHWDVKCSQDGREYDRYDRYAAHFGIFDDKARLVAVSRILTHDNPYGFMFQNEFRELVDEEKIKNIDLKRVAEISRLAIIPEKKEIKIRGHKLIEYLYKVMYKWSLTHQKHFWIFCTYERYIQNLRKNFPISFYFLGDKKRYQNDDFIQIIMVDLKEAERKVLYNFFKLQFFKLYNFFKK